MINPTTTNSIIPSTNKDKVASFKRKDITSSNDFIKIP